MEKTIKHLLAFLTVCYMQGSPRISEEVALEALTKMINAEL